MRQLLALLVLLATRAVAAPAVVAPAPRSMHEQALRAHRDAPTFPASAVRMPGPVSRPRDGDGVVMGYLPYWESPSNIPWDVVDVLAWFSLELGTDGNLGTDHGWLSASADAVRAAADQAGARVVLSVTLFGGADLETFFGDPAAVSASIPALVQRVIDGDGDGIDLDFEGLRVGNRADLVAYVQQLRAALDAAQPGLLLTLATPAVDWSDAYDYGALAAVADHLFIMGYSYSGSWSDPGPMAPLDGGPLWTSRDLTWSAQDYMALVAPAHRGRVLMGLPLYGYTWRVTADAMPADPVATVGSNFFADTLQLGQDHGRTWEPYAAAWYTNWQDGGWRQAWYDDADSLALKVEMARAQGLGGFGFWALGYDEGDADLWTEMASQAAAWGDDDDDDTGDDDTGDDDSGDDDTGDDDTGDDDTGDDDVADDDAADDDTSGPAIDLRVEAPAEATVGERVQLDAADSRGPGGATLSFSWRQTAGPAVTLWGGQTAAASFVPAEAGLYRVEVEARAGDVVEVASVEIAARDAEGGRGCGGGGAWVLAVPLFARRRRG